MGGGTDPQYFSIDHPRTKQAEHFVHGIQARRKEERQQFQQDLNERRAKLEYMKAKEA